MSVRVSVCGHYLCACLSVSVSLCVQICVHVCPFAYLCVHVCAHLYVGQTDSLSHRRILHEGVHVGFQGCCYNGYWAGTDGFPAAASAAQLVCSPQGS